jgi:hypothetical protein
MKKGNGKELMNFAKGYSIEQNMRAIRLDVVWFKLFELVL